MFSPIWFTNFVHEYFSVCAVEKENQYLIGPKHFFLSLRNHNKHSLKKIVDTAFEIGETI